MNSNGTTYQNGRFVNVDEVHNNTKNMTLSGFNQEGGTVTGNIENLKIESKQNTSVTKGSSYSGSVGVSPSGTVSGDLSLSKTNGERRYVDTPSSFIVGENSNLSIGKAENIAAIIGTTDNGKISPKVPNLSVVHDKVEKEQITRATAINTEISLKGKAEELGFNTDREKSQEVTKDNEKHLMIEMKIL